MHYVKYSFFFYSLLTVFIHAFSPPFRNILARVEDSSNFLDHESAIRSRELEDLLDSTAPSSTATTSFLDEKLTPVDPNMPLDLNVLDPQPPQLEPDITSTDVKTDQPSSLENQGNLLQYDDSQNLALLPGDTDGLPIIGPFLGGGSGEINIGPNPVQQFMENLMGPSFNPKTQPEPRCKDRALRYGGPSILHEMFAFCCKGPAHYTSRTLATGTEAQRRLSVSQRRKDCALWSRSEKCNLDTIECCYCRRDGVGFYCKKYYTKDGKPGADGDPDPAPNKQKREVILTKKSRRDSAATVARSGHVTSRQNDDDKGNSNAFLAAPEEDIQKDKGANPSSPHVCSPDFLKFEGLKPRNRPKPPAQPQIDHNSDTDWDTPYEPWTPEDELPSDESDLQLPPGWDYNPHNQRPNP